MLSAAPGSDPLNGASFFVDGPAHGAAAGAIAQLLGIDANVPVGHYLPSFKDSDSWASFAATIPGRLASNPSVGSQVQLLEKIASQPETQRISNSSQGGGPNAPGQQAQKLFCHNFTADPGTIPVVNTYFLHGALGGCPTSAQIVANRGLFDGRIDSLAAEIANRPVVLLLETDAIGSSSCIKAHGALGQWEQDLRYEVDKFSTLPHAVVYVEGGYSDSNSPRYTAKVLNAVDVSKIQGFYTNDTHLNWTIDEVKWGEKVSALTHGKHFIVNTAQNGNGPLVPSNRVKFGNELLCNPPARGLGPQPTTSTGFPLVDAFLWTSIPGNSSGKCNGGPSAGTFWAARAEMLAQNANGRLGPGYPSTPF
jgi:endoglucanase